ncbi:MAG: GAF domain-containing protein, partial [Candidatus Promineifilaceae bacterium]
GFALAILGVCLYYNYLLAVEFTSPGVTINSRWTISDIPCQRSRAGCPSPNADVRAGDQVLAINDVIIAEQREGNLEDPFAGIEPGGTVSFILQRAGRTFVAEWVVPERSFTDRVVDLVVPLLIYAPYWLTGSVIFLFMWPKDVRRTLLVATFFLMAIWLSTGIASASALALSRQISQALAWVLVPLLFHLHLSLPEPLPLGRLQYGIIALYLAAGIMAAVEIGNDALSLTFLLAILSFQGISLAVLIGRALWDRRAANRLAARLMLYGAALAFLPGILTWMLPLVLGLSVPGWLATSVAFLSLPILPVVYLYAIYKHRLGLLEVQVNRLLTTYGVTLIYLTILALILLINSQENNRDSEFAVFVMTLLLAVVLALVTLRSRFAPLVNKVTYGIAYSPDEFLRLFASRIPGVDRAALVSLLADEIAPRLNVVQSALLLASDDDNSVVYARGATAAELLTELEDPNWLLTHASRYLPHPEQSTEARPARGWIRLVVPLHSPTSLIGFWLFGHREPDDFYSHDDIELLVTLGNQVAVTLENSGLFARSQQELAERKRAEAELESYTQRLELLREIERSILAVDDSLTSGRRVLAFLPRLLPCHRASIILFGDHPGEFQVLTAMGLGAEGMISGQPLSADDYQIPPDLLTSGASLVADTHALAAPTNVERRVTELGIRSLLRVALTAGERVIGALNVGSDQPGAYSPQHVEMLRDVANSLSVALENARLLGQVTRHSDELRQLSAELISVQEKERKRIAYELHDEMGQVLAVVNANLERLRNEMPRPLKPRVAEQLAETRQQLDQVMNQIRDLSQDLRPPVLQDLGLVSALRWHVNRFSRRMGIEVALEVQELEERLPEEFETALYRILQEGLTNIARHSQASKVSLSLAQHNGFVRAVLHDNGRGFNLGATTGRGAGRRGVGLVAMRERATTLGGSLTISSEGGLGTWLTVELPLPRQEVKAHDQSIVGR